MDAIEAVSRTVKTMSDIKVRFDSKWVLDEKTGCHEWIACKSPNGYGAFQMPGRKKMGAHRVSWILNVGEIPEGMYACHKCDNRGCVNPNHLFIGTARDNALDRNYKGRNADVSGNKNAMFRITNEERAEIARLYSETDTPAKEMARMFSISVGSIRLITGFKRGKCGERNPKAKLSISDVRFIKSQLLKKVSKGSLARQFNVSKTNIRAIETGKVWANV